MIDRRGSFAEVDSSSSLSPSTGEAAASGARWLAGGQVALQLTRLVVSAVLARRLGQADFGLIALTLVLTDFLERVLGVGTSAALIQRPTITQELKSSIFFFNVMVGLATCAAIVVAAPVLGSLLGSSEVVPVLRAMSLVFVFLALSQAQRALLRRSLSFSKLAFADYANAFVQGAVAIVLAFQGFEVWALVLGVLAGKLASNLVIWSSSRWHPSWHFSRADIKEISRFSGNLSAFQFFSYFSEAGDKYVVGRMVGTSALGVYSFGYRLLLNPVNAALNVSRQVLFPTFARIQDDDATIRRGYIRAVCASALCLFPLTIGIAVLAEPLVRVVLGDKWLPAVPIVMVFGPIAAMQTVTTTVGSLYQAKGRTDLQLRWGIVLGLAMVAAYLVGSRWGALGVAWGFLFGTAVLAVPSLLIPYRLVGLLFRTLCRALVPVLAGTACMAVFALGSRLALEEVGAGPLVVLLASATAGAVSYGAVILLTRPQSLSDLVLIVRPRRGGRPSQVHDAVLDAPEDAAPAVGDPAEPDAPVSTAGEAQGSDEEQASPHGECGRHRPRWRAEGPVGAVEVHAREAPRSVLADEAGEIGAQPVVDDGLGLEVQRP